MGPVGVALENSVQTVTVVGQLIEGLELRRMLGREAAAAQGFERLQIQSIAVGEQGVAQHMPGARRGKRFLMLGRLAPQVIGTLGQVFEHQSMQLGLLRPLQPLAGADLELHMNHAVDQRRGHGAHNRGILSPVASRNHDGALRHHILAHATLQDQAVEGFLHILAAGVELVQEQAIGLLARNHGGRAKASHAVNDLWHAQQILGRELATQQGHTIKPHALRKVLHQC